MIGVIISLLVTDVTLNIMSAIGAIMLLGIVVKNGIVLVDYINLNREWGMGIKAAVVAGGKSRLCPVLMTILLQFLVDVQGIGSHDGEPHLGYHAWPSKNMATLCIVEDSMASLLKKMLRGVDSAAPKQGLRVFFWDIAEV